MSFILSYTEIYKLLIECDHFTVQGFTSFGDENKMHTLKIKDIYSDLNISKPHPKVLIFIRNKY